MGFCPLVAIACKRTCVSSIRRPRGRFLDSSPDVTVLDRKCLGAQCQVSDSCRSWQYILSLQSRNLHLRDHSTTHSDIRLLSVCMHLLAAFNICSYALNFTSRKSMTHTDWEVPSVLLALQFAKCQERLQSDCDISKQHNSYSASHHTSLEAGILVIKAVQMDMQV